MEIDNTNTTTTTADAVISDEREASPDIIIPPILQTIDNIIMNPTFSTTNEECIALPSTEKSPSSIPQVMEGEIVNNTATTTTAIATTIDEREASPIEDIVIPPILQRRESFNMNNTSRTNNEEIPQKMHGETVNITIAITNTNITYTSTATSNAITTITNTNNEPVTDILSTIKRQSIDGDNNNMNVLTSYEEINSPPSMPPSQKDTNNYGTTNQEISVATNNNIQLSPQWDMICMELQQYYCIDNIQSTQTEYHQIPQSVSVLPQHIPTSSATAQENSQPSYDNSNNNNRQQQDIVTNHKSNSEQQMTICLSSDDEDDKSFTIGQTEDYNEKNCLQSINQTFKTERDVQ